MATPRLTAKYPPSAWSLTSPGYSDYAVDSPFAVAVATAALDPGGPSALVSSSRRPALTVVVDLTRGEARQVAAVLAKASKPDCLAAGHAVWTAHNRGIPVMTSDPALLRALAADIEIDELP